MEQSSLGNILGQNVNYNVNIKTQQNNSNGQVTQLEETQNVESILKNLKVGQSFSGQITDIRGNILQISINNQNILAANGFFCISYRTRGYFYCKRK